MELDIYSVEWEYEDSLPEEMNDLEYDLMYPKSKVFGGVRMFPYIRIYDDDGNFKKCWLGV